jgi:hypothetical protein
MSGRGHHGGESPDRWFGRPLGRQIQDELRGALRLLFKSADQYPVDLTLNAHWTTYLTAIPTASVKVPLSKTAIRVSDDPVGMLSARQTVVRNAELIQEALLAATEPACTVEPVVCRKPLFDEMRFGCTTLSFQNMTPPRLNRLPIGEIAATAARQPIQKPEPSRTHTLPAMQITARSRTIADRLPPVRVKDHPRFYTLPIKKASIPPHRFSTDAKDKFRRFLAEKAGTVPANIQLKIIFERMDMSIYASIQQDEQGNLLCIPKNEFIGKNLSATSTQALLRGNTLQGSAYLVLGVRLDTREELRALVPATLVHDEDL